MSLHDQIQVKIQRIRKNIFNDVLKYNQEAAAQKRIQRKTEKQHDQQQFEQLTWRQLESLKQQQEQTFRNKERQKQSLKKEHERQMKQKKRKEEEKRKYDSAYADIQKSYLQFQNQRRMQDLQRMFNRKSYRASLAEQPKRRVRTELDNPQGYPTNNQRYNSLTPTSGDYNSMSAQKYNERQARKYQYQDSLDNIKIKGERDRYGYTEGRGQSMPIKRRIDYG